MDELLMERYALAKERVCEIKEEKAVQMPYLDFFQKTAAFLEKNVEIMDGVVFLGEAREPRKLADAADLSIDEWKELNRDLYADILPENYRNSYGNPVYACEKLGEYGKDFSFLYAELRGIVVYAFEKRLWDITVLLELFLEVYGAFAQEEVPTEEELRGILNSYANDYCQDMIEYRTRECVDPELDFAAKIIMRSDISDFRYLYLFGEYITENELGVAAFLNGLSQEEIDSCARTYTEGYRLGFVNGHKDLSKKKTVNIRYNLGFERMVKAAILQFEEMGLEVILYRAAVWSVTMSPNRKIGYHGTSANMQFDYDHRYDQAIYLDKAFKERKLAVLRTAYENCKKQAAEYAGPAVVETFGEKDFAPVNKPEAVKMTDEQSTLMVEHRTQMGQLQRQYIEEERSFTIIAFPIPEVGDCFEELFRETIRINTLDYKKYQRIQQTIIDALDQADHCEVKGCNGNHTDITVNLWKLKDPAKETIFENCVADVNIPVGEVFTSPVLEGTNGVLHVTKVFLNGLEYKNLEIIFENGRIKNYNCANFATEEENKAFIKENILFRHKTLPLGEFAIGTNTTAYVAAKRLGVEARMPILIAEKMGPHFAVGDTCYSHAEEVKVYNPDGKEIVARDNEVAALRSVNPSKAYFNCHTDITIPYDELAELTAVKKDGGRIPIIANGRFVLPGTEELNEPLRELD